MAVAQASARLAVRAKKQWPTIAAVAVLVPGAALFVAPVIWMLAVSLEPLSEVESFPPNLWPHPFEFGNYVSALTFEPFGRYFANTFFIATVATIGAVLSSSFVAFGFARLRARWKNVLFLVVLSTMVLPYAVTMVPQFVMYKYFGWIDTYYPLILPAYFGNPFFIFLFRQFFSRVPEEVFEAARLDGCGYVACWWRIMLPLSLPVLATAGIFSFQGHWQDFLAPLVYLNSSQLFTVSLGLANFTADYGGTPWNLLMAASLVALLPPVILFFFAQPRFDSYRGM